MHWVNLYLLLLISCSVTFTAAIFRTNRNETSQGGLKLTEKTSEELTSIFYSSIIYWDFDKSELTSDLTKTEMKQGIMKDLVNMSEDSKLCICPRALDTLVCDSTGKLHASICRFHCRFADNTQASITPIMILTETAFQKSKKMCQLWLKGKERWSLAEIQGQKGRNVSEPQF